MRLIVGGAVVVLLALNLPSTARAAGPSAQPASRCVRLGLDSRGAQGIVVLRPGERLDATCPQGSSTQRIVLVTVIGPGWHGTLHSPETRVDGLLGLHALTAPTLRGGGHADLRRLEQRLETAKSDVMLVRITLAVILIAFALFLPRRAVMGGPAAITAALLLSAFGSSSVVLLGLLTFALAFLPWRALWLFFPAYLAVLVLAPATQALALLGPHPFGGGRFYGVSNELETLLLAPALVLGLAAAPFVLLAIGWSRAGADGGGLLTFLAGYVALVPRPRPLVAAAAIAALSLAFVALDAATGGSSHVTHSVLHGNVLHDVWHRWHTSWNGVTGTWGRAVVCAICLAALGWVATRRSRSPLVDAFLIAILVSLVANDTPQDVLFWGAITGVGLRRAV